jgi:hypothetical protein
LDFEAVDTKDYQLEMSNYEATVTDIEYETTDNRIFEDDEYAIWDRI